MRILHLASFDGNIGDNASHMGFRKMLSEVVYGDYQVDQLEIRKFYNNYSLPDKQRFDMSFAELANKYDLLFIGGGGFLDFWVKGSATGTTINIEQPVLKAIKIPIVISSVGCIPHKEVPEENIPKFRSFLDQLLSRSDTYVAVRNDGSKKILKDLIGIEYFNNIPEILDHGFFYENDGSYYRPSEKRYILINSTSDQLQMLNRDMGKVDTGYYENEMRKSLNYFLKETDLNIVFAPHIYSDFGSIANLLSGINDFYIRSRIVITPYVQGDFGCNQIFSSYKNSALVLGMRFHANVCSIAMNKASIGLAALDRVVSVYESVGLSDNVISVDAGFSDRLLSKAMTFLKEYPESYPSTQEFVQKREETLRFYKTIFSKLRN